MVSLSTFRPEHIPALYDLYVAQTAGLPHCLLSSQVRFAVDLTRPEVGQILVAEAEGPVAGFAVLRAVTDDQDREADAVTALFFVDEVAGAALLEACVQRARSGPVLAFPQAHGNAPVQGYNAGWDGLSDRLSVQARLLAQCGFVPYYRELLLACDLDGEVGEARVSDEVAFEGGASEHGGFRQRAWLGGERVGLCLYATTAANSDDPRAARTGYVHWLWTDEATRRRGVARELMLRALVHLRSLGCERCWLGTGADNWPAQTLYLALGFVVVDSTVSFLRRER